MATSSAFPYHLPVPPATPSPGRHDTMFSPLSSSYGPDYTYHQMPSYAMDGMSLVPGQPGDYNGGSYAHSSMYSVEPHPEDVEGANINVAMVPSSRSKRHHDELHAQKHRLIKRPASRSTWHNTTMASGPSLLREIPSSISEDESVARPPQLLMMFRIEETDKVAAFIISRLKGMQQLADKKIAKAWIKGICPRKQARFPYQNKNRENEMRLVQSVPGWWPDPNTVCRFIEPDHVKRDERMNLCLHLLRLRPTPEQLKCWNDQGKEPHLTHTFHGWTKFLAQQAGSSIFDDMPGETEERTMHRKHLLEQMYDVAEMEEEYMEGQLDGKTVYQWVEDGDDRRLSALKRSRTAMSSVSSESELDSSSPYRKRIKIEPPSRPLMPTPLPSSTMSMDPSQLMPPPEYEAMPSIIPPYNSAPHHTMFASPPPHVRSGRDNRVPSVEHIQTGNYAPTFENPGHQPHNPWSDTTTSSCCASGGSTASEQYTMSMAPHTSYPTSGDCIFTQPAPTALETHVHLVNHIPDPVVQQTPDLILDTAPEFSLPLGDQGPLESTSTEYSSRPVGGGQTEYPQPGSASPSSTTSSSYGQFGISQNPHLEEMHPTGMHSVSCIGISSSHTSPHCEGEPVFEPKTAHVYVPQGLPFTQPESWHNREFTGHGSGVGGGQPT